MQFYICNNSCAKVDQLIKWPFTLDLSALPHLTLRLLSPARSSPVRVGTGAATTQPRSGQWCSRGKPHFRTRTTANCSAAATTSQLSPKFKSTATPFPTRTRVTLRPLRLPPWLTTRNNSRILSSNLTIRRSHCRPSHRHRQNPILHLQPQLRSETCSKLPVPPRNPTSKMFRTNQLPLPQLLLLRLPLQPHRQPPFNKWGEFRYLAITS